eukprot:Amastigsp_a854331_5.p3 type:complete len:188 gc:universal Amastigsp_a854331_5:317-880(+)
MCTRDPLRNAPSPAIATKNCECSGATTTPSSGARFRSSPIETATSACPWTKFVVPSIGSMIQVNSSVSMPVFPEGDVDTVSSPMSTCDGNRSATRPKISASTALSVSVAKSVTADLISMSWLWSPSSNRVTVSVIMSPPSNPRSSAVESAAATVLLSAAAIVDVASMAAVSSASRRTRAAFMATAAA